MRRLLPIWSVLLVLASAHAQTRSPEVHAIATPMSVRATLERDSAQACSQSYANGTSSGEVRLEIDRRGAARLTLDGHYVSVFGPSPGRYMSGAHEPPTRTTELNRSTWSGHAIAVGQGIDVAFDHLERAEITFTGYGTLPLPGPTQSAFSGGMHCALEAVDVLPAIEADGEVATSMRLFSCAWTAEPPAPFDHYTNAPLSLGAGAGVRNVTHQGGWSSQSPPSDSPPALTHRVGPT